MSYLDEVMADSPIYLFEFDGNLNNTGSESAYDASVAGTGVTLEGQQFRGLGVTHFDGNGYLNISTSAPNFSYENRNFTFEVWAKHDGKPTMNSPTLIRRDGNGIAVLLRGRRDPAGTEIYAHSGAAFGDDDPFDDQWHHIVMVKSGSTIQLYFDGQPDVSRSAHYSWGYHGGTMSFAIGGESGSERWIGDIAAPAIYPTALSASRIAAHYNALPYVDPNVTVPAPAADLNISTPTPTVEITEYIPPVSINVTTTPAIVEVNVLDPGVTAGISNTFLAYGYADITIGLVEPKNNQSTSISEWQTLVYDDFNDESSKDQWVTVVTGSGSIRNGGFETSGAHWRTELLSDPDAPLEADTYNYSINSEYRAATYWGFVSEDYTGDGTGQYVLSRSHNLVVRGPSGTQTFTEGGNTKGGKMTLYPDGTIEIGNNSFQITVEGAMPDVPLGMLLGRSGEGYANWEYARFSSLQSSNTFEVAPASINIDMLLPDEGYHSVDLTVAPAELEVSFPGAVASTYIPVYSYREEVMADNPLYFWMFDGDFTNSGSTPGFDLVPSTDKTSVPAYISGTHKGMGVVRMEEPYSDMSTTESLSATFEDSTVEMWVAFEYFGDYADTLISTPFGSIAVDGWPKQYVGHINEYGPKGGTPTAGTTLRHIVFVKEGTALRLYLDGELVGTDTSPATATVSSNVIVWSGSNSPRRVSAPAIYPTALSAERILAHYNAPATSTTQKNVYHGVGAVVIDITSFDVDVDTAKSANYPAQLIDYTVRAQGHGVHAQRRVDLAVSSIPVNIEAGGHVGEGNLVVDVNTTPATMEVMVPMPDVLATDTVSMKAQTVTIDVTLFDQIRGGDPNKNMAFDAVNLSLLVPNGAYAVGGHDEYTNAEATMINIEVNDPSVSNMTDVLIQTDKIGVDVRLVGFYNREEDEWADFVEKTMGNYQAYWYRFDETEGTTAYDHWTIPWYGQPDVPSSPNNGTFYGPPDPNSGDSDDRVPGEPEFGIPALDDRKAIRFSGENYFEAVDDAEPWSGEGYTGFSQEVIFRARGTGILAAGNIRVPYGAYSPPDYSPSSFIEVTEEGLRILDIGLDTTQDTDDRGEAEWNLPGIIVNDGKWHQMVWFFEDNEYSYQARTLMIDGEVVWSRTYLDQYTQLDYVRYIGGAPGTTRTGLKPLDVDVMEFIGREWSGYTRDLATRSWRIVSGHTLVDAAPAQIGPIVSPDGHKAKGNAKKMLVLVGWAEYVDREARSYGLGRSSWSGMSAPGIVQDYLFHTNAYGNSYPRYYPEDTTGSWEGYITTAVDYTRPWASDPNIIKEASDILYMNNQTGMQRFIDINKDLAVDITDFDVIHVIRWPQVIDSDIDRMFTGLDPYGRYNPRLSPSERRDMYIKRRDEFIDSIMTAVNKGVGLWIGDPKMAIDFGIAEGYDVHDFVGDDTGNALHGPAALELSDEWAASLHHTGKHYGMSGMAVRDSFILMERDIVSTATDFSEAPTTYLHRFYESRAEYDPTKWHDDVVGAKAVHYPDGLTIGSKMPLAVNSTRGNRFAGLVSRKGPIASFRPEGIKGQVIAREGATYIRGRDEVANPYANNVTTLLLERGTVLKGKPIGGRIFVEIMDNSAEYRGPDWMSMVSSTFGHRQTVTVDGPIRRALYDGYYYPDGHPGLTDFDIWSQREDLDPDIWRPELGGYVKERPDLPPTEHFQYDAYPGQEDIPEDAYYVNYPFVGMNKRGLHWLGVKPVEEFGAANVYPESVEVTYKVNEPVVQVVKHNSVEADVCSVRLEMRKPWYLLDPHVTVNTVPVRMSLEVSGYQRIVEAGVAVVGINGTTGETVEGTGEDYIVYLRNESITLYLGED